MKPKKTALDFIPKVQILKYQLKIRIYYRRRFNKNTWKSLFIGNVELIIYTKGKEGAQLFAKEQRRVESGDIKDKVRDTTGVGDRIINAFLYVLKKDQPHKLSDIKNVRYFSYLNLANYCAAHTATKAEANDALVTFQQIEDFIQTNNG